MRLLGGSETVEGKRALSVQVIFTPTQCVWFLNFQSFAIVAKTSISAMAVYVHWVCGFEAAKDDVPQMTPLQGLGKPWMHVVLWFRASAKRSPKASSADVFYLGVDSTVLGRGLWVRQDPGEQKHGVGNIPTTVAPASSWTMEGANITDISSTQNQLVRFFTSFHFMKTTEIQCKMGFKLKHIEIRKFSFLNSGQTMFHT